MEVAQRIDELWESGELDAEPIEEALALLDQRRGYASPSTETAPGS